MKILVLNCGSSSLKYQLINMETEEVLAKGNYERIGEQESFLTHKVNEQKYITKEFAQSHAGAIKVILAQLQDKEHGVITSLEEIAAIGHRIVHGGEKFTRSALVNSEVIEGIKDAIKFAPLHNPAHLQGIEACIKELSGKPNVVVFDTAFHQTMPKTSYLYPIPQKYYKQYGVRKYGFHGTSHKYVSEIAIKLLKKPKEQTKIVTCHLGQGASITAVKGGKSVDTSMGLTPLGGIAMVTRTGDLDPSVVTYIMQKDNLTPEQANDLLNKTSGISAISGLAPDFREIEKISHSDENARCAIEIFNKTIAGFIAKYAAYMNGIDAIVFTGGIGENQINVRQGICEYLEFMGVQIDKELNNIKGETKDISKEGSKVKVYIIPTNEELAIARETKELVV